MKPLLGAATLAAVLLAASACGSSRPTSNPTSGNTVSSSRLILGGAVRCTATLTTPVRVGHELGVAFSFHNVSTRTVKVSLDYGGMWMVVRSPDGTAYDTRILFENDLSVPKPPIPVQPGATLTRRLQDVRVRWEGPLRITPGCGLPSLRPVRVAVTSPGLPASERAAVNDVVAATGGLLDHCRPSKSGVAVAGRIDPPSGNVPPLQARCTISLRRARDFYVAQVLVLTPPDLQGVRVEPLYEAVTGTSVQNRNTEAIAWQFVVTRAGATSVSSAEYETTRSGGGTAPGWSWTSSGPKSSGDSPCGSSSGGSGDVNGPTVVFVSVCGR